jgi:hypothetical protein
MKLTLASFLLSTSFTFASLRGHREQQQSPPLSQQPSNFFNGQGFTVKANLNFDNTLLGNDQVIGVHLHTGMHKVNGPIGILFCGR